jgi:hypothetical protein
MNRALYSITSVKKIGYLSGGLDLATTRPTHAVALAARSINLLHQDCTCFANGTCPKCRAYNALHERNQQILEAMRASK